MSRKIIHFQFTIFNLLLLLFISSCSKDDDSYPNVVTEMADLYISADGSTSSFVLDNGTAYTISNPQTGYKANAVYRMLTGYIPTNNTAEVYSFTGVHILRDSTAQAVTDPTKVTSVWRTTRYVNLHLSPLTQGGQQKWGFITDSVTAIVSTPGDTLRHAYVTLHHRQNGDPTSYTADVYASLPIDSIKYLNTDSLRVSIRRSDRITLRIKTFDGQLTFDL